MDDLPPINNPPPLYPHDALADGITGVVYLQVEVDATGTPVDVKVVKSSHSRSLDNAAVDAAKGWHFRPKVVNGVPVPGVVMVPVRFEIPSLFQK